MDQILQIVGAVFVLAGYVLAQLGRLGTVSGAVVLGQLPTGQDLGGIALVVAGLALHEPPD